jgi:serine/threonine protein kinase
MLSDAALRHLRHVADLPDLAGTRYQLLEPIGRGGMGAVYRVRDLALDRDVAMKVLSGAVDAVSRARLEREARVLARLERIRASFPSTTSACCPMAGCST